MDRLGRIWVISDTHFGYKNANRQWADIAKDCIDGFVLPLFEKEVGDEDILVHCGDVFEDRQNINVSSMRFAIQTFEKFASIFRKVYVICGNHDVQNNTSNDVTSLDCLKYIEGVEVVKTPKRLAFSNATVGLVPWQSDNGKLVSDILGANSDFIFCHADILGATMNASGIKSEHGIDVKSIKGVKNIYSGHIHRRQVYKGVTFVGSTYSMKREDIGNTKGVYSIDADSGESVFHQNNVSPMFVTLSYEDVKDGSSDDVRGSLGNNFVDLYVDSDTAGSKGFQKFLGTLAVDSGAVDISVKLTDNGKDAVINNETGGISDGMTLEEMTDRYIDDMLDYDEPVKEKIRTISKKLINGCN